MGVVNRLPRPRPGPRDEPAPVSVSVSVSMSIPSSVILLRRLFAPRGRCGDLRAAAAVDFLRDRVEADGGGVWMCAGLCRRAGFARRGDGAGEPFRRFWSARQVPRRPLPVPVPEGGRWSLLVLLVLSSSDGGGVERRRVDGAQRERVGGRRRMSHGRAEGRSIVSG